MRLERQRLASKTNILFDLDGTLVDSSAAHARAFEETLTSVAPHANAAFNYDALKGRSTEEAFRKLGFDDPELVTALTYEKQRRFREAVDSGGVALCAGAEILLASLTQRGKRLFIVSGGSPRSTRAVLEKSGILHYFDAVVDSGMTPRSKPAPDPYLLCLRQHDLAPNASLAVEDAENGLIAARAAGLDAALVHNPELSSRYDPAFASLYALLQCLCET